MNTAAPARRRVLLAEDDEDARKVLARALDDMGLDVVEVTDGGRMLVAVAACYRAGHTRDEIDLVVTDVQMPVVSGLEIVKNIRRAGWAAPVIIVTGWQSAEVTEAARHYGAVLLPKPLDLDTFERTVRDLLESARAARDIRAAERSRRH